LNTLVDAGNTVVVVEHDMRVVASSDWVIDMGPEAGDRGGKIVASGTPEEVAKDATGRTAPYLARAMPGSGTPTGAVFRSSLAVTD
jgi:excinuclease ABC subunit A